MAGVTLTIGQDEYTLTVEQKAVYDQLIEFGMNPQQAAEIATGGYEDNLEVDA